MSSEIRSLGLLALALVVWACASPGRTQTSGSSAAADSQAFGAASNSQTNQSASQSYGGSVNNYQYNTEYGRASEYGFSTRQLRCEGPRAFIGAWADPQADQWVAGQWMGQNSWELRAGGGLTVPFGSSTATCAAMSRVLERQLNFDTAVGMVRACAELLRSGISLDDTLLEAQPSLEVCRAVSVGRRP